MTHILPSFLLTTDAKRKPDPLEDAALLSVGQGIVFRHYDVSDRWTLACTVSRIAKVRRLVLLIAADWRLAASLNAQGVHLPEGVMRSGRIAPILGWARRNKRLVTAACHTRLALGHAQKLRLSAALVSPVFATDSHPGAPCLGLIRFATLCRSTPVPVYGLGGIRKNICVRTGAKGVSGTIPLKPNRRPGTNRA